MFSRINLWIVGSAGNLKTVSFHEFFFWLVGWIGESMGIVQCQVLDVTITTYLIFFPYFLCMTKQLKCWSFDRNINITYQQSKTEINKFFWLFLLSFVLIRRLVCAKKRLIYLNAEMHWKLLLIVKNGQKKN